MTRRSTTRIRTGRGVMALLALPLLLLGTAGGRRRRTLATRWSSGA